jgi:hypothetical protein
MDKAEEDRRKADAALKKAERKERRNGWRVSTLIRLTRWLPVIKIPLEAIDYTARVAKEQAINSMNFMQMERQLGSFKFRSKINMSDTELDNLVAENQTAIMNTAREYSIAYNWMFLSGRIHEYEQFRLQVQKGIDRILAEDRKAADVEAEVRRKMAMEKLK